MFIENYRANVSEQTTPTKEGKTSNKVTTGVIVTLVATIAVLAFCLIWQKKQLEKQKNESFIMTVSECITDNLADVLDKNKMFDLDKDTEKITKIRETRFNYIENFIEFTLTELKRIQNDISEDIKKDIKCIEKLQTINGAYKKFDDLLEKMKNMKTEEIDKIVYDINSSGYNDHLNKVNKAVDAINIIKQEKNFLMKSLKEFNNNL